MNLCLNTDSLGELAFEDALDFAASLGIDSVEVATGGQSSAPHLRMAELLESSTKRTELLEAVSSRGLSLVALNCSSWPMHPAHPDSSLDVIRDSIKLANELEVNRIVTMSGCPGDSPNARIVNWIWFPWPPEMVEVREEQWEQAIGSWQELAELALSNGIERIALELHPLQLVYNVPTLLKLRAEIGPVIGANLDPSHLFWQQMDPVQVARALGPAVHHVHLKDTKLYEDELAVNGVLDPRPWDDPDNRSWIFCTVGQGHPASFWSQFIDALRESGYDDVLSIENEDPLLPGKDGVSEAVRFVKSLGHATASVGNGLKPS